MSVTPAPGRRRASATPSAGSRRGSRAPSTTGAASGNLNTSNGKDDLGAGFSLRNLYYLRSSPYTVLQMVVYLDARHLTWMNAPSDEANGMRSNGEMVLQKALAHLRTRLMDKLRRESGSNGRLSVLSRKEKVDVHASYDFQMAYFFRKMADRHAVLLKDKSLVFPQTASSMPLSTETEAGNAPIPAPSQRPNKRRRMEEDSSQAQPQEEGANGPRVKTEDEDALAEAVLHDPTLPTVQVGEHDYDPEQESYLGGAEDTFDEGQTMKPKLRVKYSGFRIFGKMLVVVIEPSKSVMSEHPELFGAAPSTEVRQLSVTPLPFGAAGRPGSRAHSQARLTSIRPPGTASVGPIPGGSGSRTAREGSRRDSRAPSPGIGTTLFLGATPTPTPEPDSRRFGSRGVSRAMSATPGPGPAPRAAASYTPAPRTRDGSPEARTNELAGAINQRSGQSLRKLPPVPRFFDGDEEGEQADEGDRRRVRQSQAPSPTPEPVQDVPPKARASSIMPRRASRRPTDEPDDFDATALPSAGLDVGDAFDFGEGGNGEGDDEDEEDEDEPATGLALATQMMEAGDHAGRRGLEADDGAE